MRRALAAVVVLGAIAAVAVAIATSGGGTHGTAARFDVIFDNARGLVGGQLVKVAGATAGSIDRVVLTADFKARIEATIDRRFMPLHADASCTIRPEGLIAENYLQCDPGTPGSPVLRGEDGHPPTVPVTDTTEPVSLTDVFNTFNLPTRERVAVILDELGIATAGRGQDINQILLRANPALGLARKVIAILAGQRAQLGTILAKTDQLARIGASNTGNLQAFIDRSAALSSLIAAHRDALSQSIARLPSLLAATQPALVQLDSIATNGTPLLQRLDSSAGMLERVSRDLGPLVAVAKPGLARLSGALRRAVPAIRQAGPLVATLERYASRSKASTELAAKLYENLQRHGFVEGFLSVVYYIATSLSRFDATSHVLPLLLVAPQNGECGNYATAPVPGCGAHYGTAPAYKPERSAALRSLTNYLFK